MQRTSDVDRRIHVSFFFDGEHFYSLRKLTVASVYCSSCDANSFIAKWIQRIFAL